MIAIIQAGANVEVKLKSGQSILEYAFQTDNSELMYAALEFGIRVEAKRLSLATSWLYKTVKAGKLALLKALIRSGVLVNSYFDGFTALHLAALQGDGKMVDSLIKAFAKVDVKT
jgi:ankyrin repeat protein